MNSITISPPYYLEDPTILHKAYTIRICKILNQFSDFYILYPEFDKRNRLHYHGTITIKDKIKYHKVLHKLNLIGFTKIDPFKKDFTHKLTWLVYCQKHYAEIAEHFSVITYKSLRRRKQYMAYKDTKRKSIMDYIVKYKRSS